ncbi:hypothetical protein [uncultured Brevundimonas sp.]|tara:strand:+ start:172 stop:306 length:135 start_codon:yes stop_codon:yes gene_type:complete
MSPETQTLIQRWFDRFGEPPVLIDEALMRRFLDEDADAPDAAGR